jgi:serine/threonine protein kinase, bacterial
VGHRPRREVKVGLIAAIVVVPAAAGTTGYFMWPHPRASQSAQPAAPPVETVLPFTGLNRPSGVAVDTAGNVYVAETNNYRVLKLAAGSSTPVVLPFTGLGNPYGVAVDSAGNLYVADFAMPVCRACDTSNNRVVKLAAG